MYLYLKKKNKYLMHHLNFSQGNCKQQHDDGDENVVGIFTSKMQHTVRPDCVWAPRINVTNTESGSVSEKKNKECRNSGLPSFQTLKQEVIHPLGSWSSHGDVSHSTGCDLITFHLWPGRPLTHRRLWGSGEFLRAAPPDSKRNTHQQAHGVKNLYF